MPELVSDHSASWKEAENGDTLSRISPGYLRYAMTVLLAIYVINHLDRQVVNILAEPIKRDLGLADWELGLMSGLAFAVLYTLLGIPIARFAERGNRPLIIATAVAVWSGFTLLSSTAQNIVQLVLARIGVGIGEAGCTPPAHSLIVDYAPVEKRSSTLAFYGMGLPLGSLIGMAFGGLVADAYGWRTAFLLAGLPGLLLAVLAALTLKEPRRQLARQGKRFKPASATFGETLRLLATKRSLWFLTSANTIKAFVAMGNAPFIASFFLRSHSEALAETARNAGQLVGVDLQSVGFLGIALGLLTGVCGALGFWGGGQLADRFGGGKMRRYMHFSALAALLTVPPAIIILCTPSLGLALGLVGLHAFFNGLHYGPTYSIAFSVVPPHMRATTSALMLFVVNLLALGLGPLTVGLLSDGFGASLGSAEGLRYALLVFSAAPLIAVACFMIGAIYVEHDVEQ